MKWDNALFWIWYLLSVKNFQSTQAKQNLGISRGLLSKCPRPEHLVFFVWEFPPGTHLLIAGRKGVSWRDILLCYKGLGKRGHIVGDTLLPTMFLGLRKLGNICCGHKICVRNNVVRAGKRGNICVGNNVSATMCPRLPGPLFNKL